MAGLRKALPVILVGQTTSIGKPVAAALLPEYKVIRFIQTREQGLAEIPRILAGQPPLSPPPTDIGSNDFSQPARAVIFGRSYTLDDVKSFQEASKGANKEPVAWIAGNPNTKPTISLPPGPDYAKGVTQVSKDALTKWVEEGASKEELLLY